MDCSLNLFDWLNYFNLEQLTEIFCHRKMFEISLSSLSFYSTATFVVAIFGVVAEILGMNFEIQLFDVPSAKLLSCGSFATSFYEFPSGTCLLYLIFNYLQVTTTEKEQRLNLTSTCRKFI